MGYINGLSRKKGLAVLLSVVIGVGVSASQTAGDEVELSYLDAYFTNAYGAEAFDVSYTIEYSARPSLEKNNAAAHNITLSKKLHGRQIVDMNAKHCLWLEERILFDDSVRLRLNDLKQKSVVGWTCLGEINGEIYNSYAFGKSKDWIISRPGNFRRLLEESSLIAIPLVPAWGWKTTYKASEVDAEKLLVSQIGDPTIKKLGNDVVQIDYEKSFANFRQNVVFRFNVRSASLISSTTHRQAKGFPAYVAERVVYETNDFDGVELPTRIECMNKDDTQAFAAEGIPHMVYEVNRVVTLNWKHVNQPTRLEFPNAEELNDPKEAIKFLGIQ